ncbi:DUF2783 domain-containing protein [Paraneptunicella aestuarii]|uniref:DUF2783 domain-containing protein n=1 Tax=Paraneptunicella aestuarii TaxID=2831148 RepID=UPI001E58AE25|nr:DUF2783 domain-containing protein [Paraneptunicella aestuarii]UAA37447.1 DUF2783 domain-containing protein [Paraneptunicella aestuarii]
MASKLNTQPNMTDPDAFYAALTEAHRDLDDSESERLNARLVLLLSNHIGDMSVLQEALNIARDMASTESK